MPFATFMIAVDVLFSSNSDDHDAVKLGASANPSQRLALYKIKACSKIAEFVITNANK
jgi:hypothetical protein